MKRLFTLTLLCLAATTLFAQPRRTPVLTGNVSADFKAVEKTSASGFAYAITWDSKFLYIGVTGDGPYIKNEPTLIYIDTLGPGGRDTSFDYDSRRGPLPFTANCAIYMKAGYAELRRDSVKGFDRWSSQKVVTDSLRTGTNDIEIKLPWSLVTGKNKIPAEIGVLLYKTNGNGSQNDAYLVRPGVTSKNNDYTGNVMTSPVQLFYRIRTESRFYTNINVFSWITNSGGNLCNIPGVANIPETNKTTTTVKLNWQAVAGAAQYQVRRRVHGTTTWKNTFVPASRTYTKIIGLECGTIYDWVVRALCDTTGDVDIASGFTAQRTFSTLSCGSRDADEAREINLEEATEKQLVVYPVPARRGSRINVSSQDFKNNSGFSIYSIAGKQVQQGIINNGAVNLSNNVVAGTYIMEMRNNNTIVRKKIVVME